MSDDLQEIISARHLESERPKRTMLSLPPAVYAAFRLRSGGQPLATTILNLAWTKELELQEKERQRLRIKKMGPAYIACSNLPFEHIAHFLPAVPGMPTCPFEIGPYPCTLKAGHCPEEIHVSHGPEGEILASWDEES